MRPQTQHPAWSRFLGFLSPRLSRLVLVLAFAPVGLAVAQCYFSETITFQQPDGTEIQLRGEGNKFYAVFEDMDGYTVTFNPQTRAYHYARVSADGSELVPVGPPVGKARPAQLGLLKRQRISAAARGKQIAERFKQWDDALEISKRWGELKAAARMDGGGGGGDGDDGGPIVMAPPSFTVTGNKMGLTILIDFSDAVGTISPSEVNNYLNQTGYTGYSNNGSVKDYFYDVSNGLLVYSNAIPLLYIRVPQPKSYYNDTTKDSGAQGRLLINDALTVMKALPNYNSEILPLFSDLTVDGNNRVVAFNVFFAGANSGVWAKGLWPHSWSLASAVALGNGKSVFRYQITQLGTALNLGTFCHENGHMLCGYPDLYDYGGDSIGGAGHFCLMGSGNHYTQKNPAQICAYLKRASGWATTLAINSNSVLQASLSASGADFNKFYLYQKPGVATEYYLVENRQKAGRDAGIAGGGIFIWHVDELGQRDNQSTNYNTSHANYELSLMQADNLWHFQRNINQGDSSDPYYSGNPAAAYTNAFTDTTPVSARWWDGSLSHIKFRNFSTKANTMTFQVGELAANPVLANLALTAESCYPTNGVIDPGETVTVQITLRNDGSLPTSSLVATLVATGGVSGVSSPQDYGALAAGGGTATRSFTFTADGSCGGTVPIVLQLQDGGTNHGTRSQTINLGALTVVWSQNFDGVTAPTLPAGWTTAAGGAQSAWTTVTAQRDTLPNSVFSPDPSTVGSNELVSPLIPITVPTARLSFRNYYSTEANWDGGVLEIKIGGGAFMDILAAGGSFVTGGYNSTLGTGNPLAGRSAWSGNSGGFITTTVNLPASAAGQNIQLRWRCATDGSVAGNGWWVDTVTISEWTCCSGSGLAQLVPAGATVTAESCAPTNGVIDPFEAVTVQFAIQNVGTGDTANLTATLLSAGGVQFPSAPQTYGAIVAGGSAVSRPFTFVAGGNCGGTVQAILQLQDGAVDYGTITNTINFPGVCCDTGGTNSTALLRNLTSSAGALTPTFTFNTFSYSAAVGYGTTNVTVTPTALDTNSTIKVNGNTVASGGVSGSISLNPGPNVINTVVVSPNLTRTNTYALTVTRDPGSSNAFLVNLTSSEAALNPTFVSNTFAYAASVPYSIAAFSVTPTAADSTATITVNGTPVASGSASGFVNLNVGANVINTRVVSQNQTVTNTYAVTVTRAPGSTNAYLTDLVASSGPLTPTFVSNTFSYAASVPFGTGNVTMTPTAADPNAVITVNGNVVASGSSYGPISLTVGDNIITNRVVSEDQSVTNNYLFTVTRAASVTRWWDGGSVNLAGNGNGASGGGSGLWNTTVQNWDQGNGLPYVAWNNANGNVASFGGSGGTVTNEGVVVGGMVFTAAYTVTNGIITYASAGIISNSAAVTIVSEISGAGPITKEGVGALTLRGNNSYTGGTILNGGTLNISADANLGESAGEVSGGITINGPAHLHINNPIPESARPILLNGGATNTVTLAGAVIYTNSSPVTGSGGLIFKQSGSGARNAVLASVGNNFTGVLGVDQAGATGQRVTVTVHSLADSDQNLFFGQASSAAPATFQLGAGANAPLVLNNRRVELGGGANSFATINNISKFHPLVINTDVLITGAAGARTLALGGDAGATNIFRGNIADGSGSVVSFTKAGSSIWALSGTNTYSGATVLSAANPAGSLIIQGKQALSSNTAIRMVQSSSSNCRLVVLDDGVGTINLPNTLTIDHQNSVLNMALFVGNNHPSNGGNNPASATTGSTVAFAKLNWTNLNNGQGLTGIGSFEGANGYRLKFNQVDLPAFPSAFTSLNRWTGRFCPTSAPVTLAGVIQQLAGTAAPNATQPILGLDGTHADNLIEGEIRDAADYPGNSLTKPLQVNKTSTSTWTLTGTNTYSGPTFIENGTLAIASLASVGGGASALGAPTTVANGTIHIGTNTTTGTLRYIGTGHTSDRVINLAGTTGGAVLEQAGSGLWKLTSDFTATGAGKKSLILGGATAGIGEIAGAIVDNSIVNTTTVVKVGSGTWILSGNNTYSGATTISNGTLVVNGSLSDGTAALTVVSNATLSGTGTIGRNVTVANGGKLEFNISTAAASHAKLNIAAGRSFGFAGASALTITSSGGAAPGTYTLVSGGNNITGVAPATVNLPDGWVGTVSISGNSLLLNLVSIGGASYTVTYNGNGNTGGAAPVDGNSPYNAGATVTVLGNTGGLTKTGHTFAGWNTAADGSGTAYAPAATFTITADTTLYAQWTPNTYTVTFNPNGGGTPSPTSKSVTYGATYGTLATVSRSGYAFAGWFTAAAGGTEVTSSTTVTITADQTLYAQWVPNTYTVSYNANGATAGSAPSNQTKTHDVPLTLASNTGGLTKTGYTFAGWNTAADGSGADYAEGASYTANAAVTLYAKWTANTYTVTLDRQGGTGGSASVSATFGAAMPSATAPTRAGYTFGGYYTEVSGGGTQYYTAGMASAQNWDIAAATTLYAKWTLVPIAVVTDLDTVNVPEGGTETFQVKLSAQPAGNVTVTVSRTAGDTDITVQSGGTLNFTTENWNTYQTVTLAAANDADADNGTATITCDVNDAAYTDKDVTAVEIDKDTTLTVTNDGNGTTAPAGAVVVEKGSATAISATANTGYDFVNWTVTSGSAAFGDANATNTTATISAPATVRANFTLKTYTVSYDGNGNTGGTAPANQTKTHGVDLTLATNSGNLTKTGYSFSGWNTAADGSGTDYAAGATYTANAAVTLYAKWSTGFDGTWIQTAAGPFDWGTPANWSGNIVATGVDKTAFFTPNITAAQTVNLETARTIGNITFTDSTSSSHNLTISGANILTLSRSSGVPVIDVTQSGRTLTISSEIAGSNGLQKNGPGQLTLSGVNSYAGGTTINGGQLYITSDANLGATSGGVTFTGNATLRFDNATVWSLDAGRTITIQDGVVATFASGNGAKTIAGIVQGNGSMIWSSTTALKLANANNTFNGPITITTGSTTTPYGFEPSSLGDTVGAGLISLNNGHFLWRGNSGSTTTFAIRQFALSGTTSGGFIYGLGLTAADNLVINRDLLITGTGNKTLTLTGSNTGDNTFAGNISDASGSVISLTKAGAGKWILAGTNTYSGITINGFNNPAGAGLVFRGMRALSPNTTLQQTHAGGTGGFGVISLLDDSPTPESRSSVNLNMLASNTSHTKTLYVDRISGANTGSTIELGNLNFTQSASGNTSQQLNVTGANSYRLRLNNVNLPALVSGTTSWKAVLNPTTAPLTIAGTVRQVAGSVAGTMTLELNGSAAGNAILGTIQDSADGTPRSLALTKLSSSEWTLSGNNSYSGATTISAGKLFINGDQSAAAGNVSVAANATLGGTGTLGGDVTVAANGRLEFNISTAPASHDSLELVTGKTLTFSGASVLTINSTGGATIGTYTLVTGGNNISGSAPATVNLPSGWSATVSISGNSLLLNVTSVGAVTYTVAYNGNGNTGGNVPVDSNSPYNAGATVTVLGNTGNLTKTGYAFTGWNTAANGSGASYAPGATFTIAANTTLYAQWTEANPPPVPTGLVAEAGNSLVNLSWNSSASATSYNLKRSLNSGGPYATIQSPSTTGYTDTGLTNGVTYYYVVSAVNANGESANSAEVSATPYAISLPFTLWQVAQFGSAIAPQAGIAADPDGNGFVNLLEYAFVRNPTVTNTAPLITASTESAAGQRYLTLTFLRRKNDPALNYIPQVSGNLATWNTGSDHAELLSVTDLDEVREEVQYRIKGPISQTALQYARVLVSLSGHTNAAAVYAAQRQTLVTGQNYMAAPVGLTAHTLGGLLATNQFAAGDTEANATVVDLWDQAGQTMGARYFNSSAAGFLGWRQSGNFADANNLALDANKGFILTVRSGVATNYVVGLLPRAAQTQTVQNNGYTLAGSRFPVPISPANANLLGSGFVGGSSLVTSDSLLLFNPATQQFDVKLWYDSGGGVWRDQSGAVATQQLPPGAGILIKRRNRAAGNFTWTNPVPYNVTEVWP